MKIFPFLVLPIVLYAGREDLSWRCWLVVLALSAILFISTAMVATHWYAFVAAQCMLDIIMILVVFGGDINIR